MQTAERVSLDWQTRLVAGFGLFLILVSCCGPVMDLPLLLHLPITQAKLLEPGNLTSLIGSSLFTLVFLIGGVVITLRGFRGLAARGHVAAPEASLSNSSPRVGETVTFKYRQVFRTATEVTSIKLQLILRESATYGHGTDVTTDAYTIVVQEYKVAGRQYDPGQSFEDQYEFQPRGMHSYDGPSNELDWFVYVQVEMTGLPAFTSEYPLEVMPEMAR